MMFYDIEIAPVLMQKYARRWDQGTISERILKTLKKSCPENPIFCNDKQIIYDFYRLSITTLLLTFARVTRFESETGHDNKNGIWRVSVLQRRGLDFKNDHVAEARRMHRGWPWTTLIFIKNN